jgi:para-aminobenzoate synthetase component 1
MSIQQKMNQWGAEKKPFIFLIDFECTNPKVWLINNCPNSFAFNFNGFTNYVSTTKKTTDFTFKKFPIGLQAYTPLFNSVQHQLNVGNSFLINLTISTKIETSLSFQQIFEHASAKYKLWLKDEFVCFSPETFIQIRKQQIHTFPMKGTIDATIPNAKAIILNSEKEKAEHATIVDLLRNDLSKVATNVRLSKYRYYEVIQSKAAQIGQVSSEIIGNLPANYCEQLGDIIFSLLPAGSISGAPKKKTIEIIKKVEGKERGYYTGIAGYFDGENVDSCVLIRYLDNHQYYRSGGGITFQSNAVDEYQEMLNKVYVPIY